jgi:PhnB protein
MIKVNPYLNFDGKTEEAFTFYKSVFGGDFSLVARMKDSPGGDKLPENEQDRLMHISLPISDSITLMGSDIFPSFGHKLDMGNSVHISVHPDSRSEADRLFNGLSAGGKVEMPMADQFWGDYFGSFVDKYGIYWMINYSNQV